MLVESEDSMHLAVRTPAASSCQRISWSQDSLYHIVDISLT